MTREYIIKKSITKPQAESILALIIISTAFQLATEKHKGLFGLCLGVFKVALLVDEFF